MQLTIVQSFLVSIYPSVLTGGDCIHRPEGTLKNKLIAKSCAINYILSL